MSVAKHFSRDYAEARGRFLGAARRLGLEVESHQFAARGPAGEPLFLAKVDNPTAS